MVGMAEGARVSALKGDLKFPIRWVWHVWRLQGMHVRTLLHGYASYQIPPHNKVRR